MNPKVLLLYCLFFVPASLYSKGNVQYGSIYNSLKEQPSSVITTLGDSHFLRNSVDTALVCYSVVASRYTNTMSLDEKKLSAHASNRCGIIYYNLSNYTKALQSFVKALEICKETNYTPYDARVYNNIGNIYSIFRDYFHAKSYYSKALEHCPSGNEKMLKSVILNNLIGVNSELGDIANTKKYLHLFEELKLPADASYFFHITTGQGIIEKISTKYDSALKCFRRSIEYARKSATPNPNIYVVYYNISQIYSHIHKNDSALVYLNKCAKIAQDNGYMNFLPETYKALSEIYRRKGDEKMELSYKKKYLNLNDSIFNTKEFGKIKDIQSLYEMENIEKQVRELTDRQVIDNNRIHFQKQIIRVISIASGIIIGLLAYLFWQYRKQRETSISLFNRNIEIMTSEKSERETRITYEERLREKDQQLALLKQKYSDKIEEHLNDLVLNIDNKADEEPLDNKTKYQNSVLRETDKLQLQEAIWTVMNDTSEFCSIGFSLEKLASLVNSRPKYVSQIINEMYGKNFNVFLNEYRIKEARKRLMDTQNYHYYSIAGISESVGFKSKANFNMIFKKITGFTPSEYQKMAKSHYFENTETL